MYHTILCRYFTNDSGRNDRECEEEEPAHERAYHSSIQRRIDATISLLGEIWLPSTRRKEAKIMVRPITGHGGGYPIAGRHPHYGIT